MRRRPRPARRSRRGAAQRRPRRSISPATRYRGGLVTYSDVLLARGAAALAGGADDRNAKARSARDTASLVQGARRRLARAGARRRSNEPLARRPVHRRDCWRAAVVAWLRARRHERAAHPVRLYRRRRSLSRRAGGRHGRLRLARSRDSASPPGRALLRHRSGDAYRAGRAGAGQRHRRADPDRLGRGQRRQADAEAAAAAADAERARSDLARLLAVRKRRCRRGRRQGHRRRARGAAPGPRPGRGGAPHRRRPPRPDRRRAGPGRSRRTAAEAKWRSASASSRRSRRPPAASTRSSTSPANGSPANQPIVSLLPDDKVKVRFFVPEREVARYRPGGTVRFACDGCAAGLTATIRYVSPQPEFTPPVIFSRDSRDRLVFMVEAVPPHPASLQPGLPVDVDAAAVTLAIDVTRAQQELRRAPRRQGRRDPGRGRAISPASSAPTARARRPPCGCCAGC